MTLRGNVPTRVRKLREGEAEAIILAAAGLERLQRGSRREAAGDAEIRAADATAAPLDLAGLESLRLDPEVFVPPPAQGALALQCRRDDPTQAVLAELNDAAVAVPVHAERELLRLVDGGCNLPFGAWCRAMPNGELELIAILEIDGEIVRVRQRGSDAGALAAAAWGDLVAAGATRAARPDTPGAERAVAAAPGEVGTGE